MPDSILQAMNPWPSPSDSRTLQSSRTMAPKVSGRAEVWGDRVIL